MDATLMAAAWRRSVRRGAGAAPIIVRADLRRKLRRRRLPWLVVFVVDASDSMGAGARMAAAKAAVLGLLASAHAQRDRVALVAFAGEGARLALRPTRSATLAMDRLQELRTGGATPLADGLRTARQTIVNERARDSELRPVVVVISDGEANVPLCAGRRLESELREQAELLRRMGAQSTVIDTAPLGARHGVLVDVAGWLGAGYHRAVQLDPAGLMAHVRIG